MKKFFNLLKPAVHLPEMTDPVLIEKSYRYWRWRIFYSMFFGYAFFYFTRKSLTFVTPFLIQDLGLTKGDIGILVSVLSITYGIGKFTSGILSDRSNPRYFMALGLMMTAVSTLCFGFSSSLVLLAIFWGFNGWFQGWGWPACTKQLTYWYSRSERGTWWSVATSSHTLGGFLIAFISAYCAKWYGWRWGIFVPSIICILASFWLMNRLRDIPQTLGFPTIEKFKNEPLDEYENMPEALPAKELLLKFILSNKHIWILATSYFFVYVVRTAINDWGALFLTETKGYSVTSAAACVAWFEIGSFFGVIVAGWGSDYWFGGKRVPLTIICSILLSMGILGLWYLGPDHYLLVSLLIALLGFLISGPQMLVGLAAAEFVHKRAASTANGFAGFFGSLGAAFAGYPLGRFTEIFGWYQGFSIVLFFCCLICAAVLMPIWSVKSGRADEVESELGLAQPSVR